MFSFDGNYRPRREINLGGRKGLQNTAQSLNRHHPHHRQPQQLISQWERHERERQRQLKHACLRIENAWWRLKWRRYALQSARSDWMRRLSGESWAELDMSAAELVCRLRRFLFYARLPADHVVLCQLMDSVFGSTGRATVWLGSEQEDGCAAVADEEKKRSSVTRLAHELGRLYHRVLDHLSGLASLGMEDVDAHLIDMFSLLYGNTSDNAFNLTLAQARRFQTRLWSHIQLDRWFAATRLALLDMDMSHPVMERLLQVTSGLFPFLAESRPPLDFMSALSLFASWLLTLPSKSAVGERLQGDLCRAARNDKDRVSGSIHLLAHTVHQVCLRWQQADASYWIPMVGALSNLFQMIASLPDSAELVDHIVRLDDDQDRSEDAEDDDDLPGSARTTPIDPDLVHLLHACAKQLLHSDLVQRLFHANPDPGKNQEALRALLRLSLNLFPLAPKSKYVLIQRLLVDKYLVMPLMWKQFDEEARIIQLWDDFALLFHDPAGQSSVVTVYIMAELLGWYLVTCGNEEFSGNHQVFSAANLIQLTRLSTLYEKGDVTIPEGMFVADSFLSLSRLRDSITRFLRLVHRRDSVLNFCPSRHWIVEVAGASPEELIRCVRSDEEMEEDRKSGPSPLGLLLKSMPFVFPFEDRIRLFRHLVGGESYTDQFRNVLPYARVRIRREFAFEDGFATLDPLGSSLRHRIAISLINELGYEEAGVDGGGVFKEFFTILARQAFNPNFGLFCHTADQSVYPNPNDYAKDASRLAQFQFLGRIVGKALYDGFLMDVSFATFFLSKWIGRLSYLEELASLDADLYRNLIFLKNYDGNVEDLSLNFTVSTNEFGVTKEVELIAGGSQMIVTNENRIQYIYLVASHKLNIQIGPQCRAFLSGLADLIDSRWLAFFNEHELHIMTSGAEIPIDFDDMMQHTTLDGYERDSPQMEAFWSILKGFDVEHKRLFLKFVTSCSRPPLLGFGELHPQLCIRNAGNDDERLPSASTCFNLLKLPSYSSREIMSEKLRYAIESAQTFELS